ncbi:yeats family-domain-containing protein [Chytridium lagenaria]|nr:yeats family-domain-containing protein [Chytridium lagenaria]
MSNAESLSEIPQDTSFLVDSVRYQLFKIGKESKISGRDEFMWIVYLQGPPSNPDLSIFVDKVEFFLHSDYKPFDVVTVAEPPFQLIRYGWGEFPIRIRLYFLDYINKPVDIIYTLKLDRFLTGSHVLGGEAWMDIELDRKTEFGLTRTKLGEVKKTQKVLQKEVESSGLNKENIINSLRRLLPEYPMISDDLDYCARAPYPVASSFQEFKSWNEMARKTSEFQRAQFLSQEIEKLVPESGVSELEIMAWCKALGFTPVVETTRTQKATPVFCKFCGLYEDTCQTRSFMDCKKALATLQSTPFTSCTSFKSVLRQCNLQSNANSFPIFKKHDCGLSLWTLKLENVPQNSRIWILDCISSFNIPSLFLPELEFHKENEVYPAFMTIPRMALRCFSIRSFEYSLKKFSQRVSRPSDIVCGTEIYMISKAAQAFFCLRM